MSPPSPGQEVRGLKKDPSKTDHLRWLARLEQWFSAKTQNRLNPGSLDLPSDQLIKRPIHSTGRIALLAMLIILVAAVILAVILLLQTETTDVDDVLITPLPSVATVTKASPTPNIIGANPVPCTHIIQTWSSPIDIQPLVCAQTAQFLMKK